MTEMIKRVARAMAGVDLSKMHAVDREVWLENARDAIEAMREPTVEMLAAGLECEGLDLASEWRAMIDCAVSPAKSSSDD